MDVVIYGILSMGMILGMMSIGLNLLRVKLFLESDIFNNHKSNANQTHKKLGYLVVLFFYRLTFY